MRIETTATMASAPDAVYAAIADLQGRPRWLTEMSDVDAPATPAGAGTHFTANSSLLLHRFHGASHVEVADANRRFVEEVHLGARFVSEWTVEPHEEGTVLRHRIDLDLPAGPLGWVARTLLGWRLRRMSRHSQ